ncbi:hypothetical protein GCM10007901_17650 [Dyella acidisoli]|uniref:Uncharacterized protein n=1 Tax=Dyella acidisoli TaxID=1867834 RepID=A0ABQ5XNR9_9GAMM|nr:hypothetical protein GCM10007901_17650 [Dyella acidisoli]
MLTVSRRRLPHIDGIDPNEGFTELVLENFLVTVSQVTGFALRYVAAQQNPQVNPLAIRA